MSPGIVTEGNQSARLACGPNCYRLHAAWPSYTAYWRRSMSSGQVGFSQWAVRWSPSAPVCDTAAVRQGRLRLFQQRTHARITVCVNAPLLPSIDWGRVDLTGATKQPPICAGNGRLHSHQVILPSATCASGIAFATPMTTPSGALTTETH